MWGRAWIMLLVAVALGGCGGEEPTLSASSAEELHAQVSSVREAAANGDRAAALESLDGLADRVRDLEADGSLAESDATVLRRGIVRARRQVRAELPPAPTPTPTPAQTAEPEPEGEPGTGNDEAKGESEGKGKDKDKDEKGKDD